MELDNKTPCLAIAWQNLDSDGNENITALVRGKFQLLPTSAEGQWLLGLAENQGDFFGADAHYDDDINRSLQYESDYVPFKPKTDVVINATSYSTDNHQLRDWLCGIKIRNEDKTVCLEKWLKVTGKRYWRGDILGWVLDEPEFTNQVPIRYENAFGGEVVKRAPGKEDQYVTVCYSNPIGTGLLHRKHPDKVVAAPQILSPEEPIDRLLPYKSYTPQGLGFYHRAWDLRLPLAGTYDDDWQANQWPLPPHDFDPAFNQAAHPDMIVNGYLQGGETVTLYNLLPGRNKQEFHLPKLVTLMHAEVNGESHVLPLFLDTVLLDIDSTNSDDWAVYLSWRLRFKAIEGLKSAEVFMLGREQIENIIGNMEKNT